MAGTRARLTLDDYKPAAAVAAPPPKADEARRGQTLRLRMSAHRQLNVMAAEQGRPAHDLLIEAVNLLFTRYDKPPIAG
jgi:hypothetical protein